MDNEKKISGIPSVNDIKLEDTPAVSFENLYGNSAENVQPQPMPNPQPAQPVQPQPMLNPQPAQPVQPQPMLNPQPAQPVQPQPMPNPQPAQPVQPQPMPNPQPAQPVQPQPMPNPQPVQPVQPQPMPNPQPVQIDAERMQSIEEQLSKTSQYKPEDFQQEKIDIPTTSQYEKNKSGLTFVIILFVILILAIIAMPYITNFFS